MRYLDLGYLDPLSMLIQTITLTSEKATDKVAIYALPLSLHSEQIQTAPVMRKLITNRARLAPSMEEVKRMSLDVLLVIAAMKND